MAYNYCIYLQAYANTSSKESSAGVCVVTPVSLAVTSVCVATCRRPLDLERRLLSSKRSFRRSSWRLPFCNLSTCSCNFEDVPAVTAPTDVRVHSRFLSCFLIAVEADVVAVEALIGVSTSRRLEGIDVSTPPSIPLTAGLLLKAVTNSSSSSETWNKKKHLLKLPLIAIVQKCMGVN